jgi:hypothetical protein
MNSLHGKMVWVQRTAVWILLTITATSAHSADQRWIHGSWVNLRSGPSADARIVTQLTINTPVTVHTKQGEWCEISVATPTARGYVVCKLIGGKPLSLADLGQPRLPGGRPNPDFSPERAFWIAPSVSRLLQAGDFYWRTMLNQNQRAREVIDVYREQGKKQEKPHRFPIAEFDAMKERMQKGVVAPPDSRPTMPREEFVEREGLRPVKPSLFKRVTDLAPASSSVEQLSAQFEILEQARVLSGPDWVHHRHDTPRVLGHWDIGSLQLTLQKPLVEYVVGRQGLAAALQWKAEEIQDYKAEHYCTRGFSLAQRAKVRLPGYPEVKDPLVWFFVPQALPNKKGNQTMARDSNDIASHVRN